MGVIALRLTPQADADLNESAEYIARDNPQAAVRFLDAVENDTQKLRLQPDLGSLRYCDLLPGVGPVRFWPVHGFSNWLIFYLSSSTEILILRVLNGKRDLPALF